MRLRIAASLCSATIRSKLATRSLTAQRLKCEVSALGGGCDWCGVWRVRLLTLVFASKTPATSVRQPRRMATMTQASKTPIILSVLWYIARMTTSRVFEIPFFSRATRLCQYYQPSAKRIASNNNISFLCAASGMIAKYIDGLLAQRAGDLMIQDRDFEAIGDRNLKVSGAQQSFFCHPRH